MNLIDRGHMVAGRETDADGQEHTVGVLEYHRDSNAKTVMTGTLLTMPHIDTFEVARDLVVFLRELYPREDGWRLITDVGSCATRPIWQAWIDKGKELGIDPFDEVGDLTDLDIQATHDWPLGPAVLALDWTSKEFPATAQIRAILDGIDAEIATE